MSFDYDRLRELAGKAGPGPWTVEINDWDEVIVANDSGHAMSWGEQVRFEMKGGNRNVEPHLIALAPDMARELLDLRDGVEQQITHLEALLEAAKVTEHYGFAGPIQASVIELSELLNGDAE